MSTEIKIGQKEITSVMVNLLCIKMLLTFPRGMVVISGNAAWMQGIYLTLIALGIFWITTKLYTSDESILEVAEQVGGKWLKIVTGLVTLVILLLNMASTLRVFPESVRMILLQATPMEFIIVLFAATIMIGVYFGIESLARISSLLLPIMGAVLAIFLILIIPFLKPSNLTPIMGKGAKEIFISGFHYISAFSDIILLNILLPFCRNKKEAIKSGYHAILISGAIIVLILLVYGLVYPYPISTEFILPVYQLTRILQIGDFFARLDAFFEFIWTLGTLLYAGIYAYILCHIWKKTFDLKYYKPLIMGIVIITMVVSFFPSSIVQLIRMYNNFSYIMYPFAFALPILFGILYRIKQRP